MAALTLSHELQPSIYHATVSVSVQIEICNLDRTKSSFLATSLYKRCIFTKSFCYNGLVAPAIKIYSLVINPNLKSTIAYQRVLGFISVGNWSMAAGEWGSSAKASWCHARVLCWCVSISTPIYDLWPLLHLMQGPYILFGPWIPDLLTNYHIL